MLSLLPDMMHTVKILGPFLVKFFDVAGTMFIVSNFHTYLDNVYFIDGEIEAQSLNHLSKYTQLVYRRD